MEWLTAKLAAEFHRQLIAEHGGAPGTRDANLLESAIARARNLYEYEKADVYRMAAAYAFGIARNHPFVDGNKRTALMAMYTFLGLNGAELTATEEDAYDVIIRLAAGKLDEVELAEWVRANVEKSEGD